jgi:FemAB-related protein (PEP-CTERM system-associated)
VAQPLVLRALDDDVEDPRWNRYVESHPDGTFYHLVEWRRVLRRTYGRPSHLLYVERGGAIVGVLPAYESGGKPFTRALVSVPVGVGGGVLADDDTIARMLLDGAHAVAEREGLAYVELKSETQRFEHLYTKGDLYFTFRQELFGDRDQQMSAIPRKTRAVLREAERSKLRARYNREDLDAFIDLYALSLRNLGTPMFPRELFVAALEELGDRCDLLTVRQTGRIIGCVMNFYFKDVMLPFFAGTLPEARDVGVNNYIYWAMLETGYDLGYRVFDFGRSKAGTGAFKFKKHFGMEPQPLAYQYDLVTIDEPPNFNPTNPKYAKAIDTWKRLPVGLTKAFGPFISKRLP